MFQRHSGQRSSSTTRINGHGVGACDVSLRPQASGTIHHYDLALSYARLGDCVDDCDVQWLVTWEQSYKIANGKGGTKVGVAVEETEVREG